jgi:translation initiation factor 2 beta subunit (eIF-2beta)/eIF-5
MVDNLVLRITCENSPPLVAPPLHLSLSSPFCYSCPPFPQLPHTQTKERKKIQNQKINKEATKTSNKDTKPKEKKTKNNYDDLYKGLGTNVTYKCKVVSPLCNKLHLDYSFETIESSRPLLIWQDIIHPN